VKNPREVLRAPVVLGGFAVDGARVLLRTGLIRPARPDRLARAVARHGATPAALPALAAARYPDRAAILDERGAITYAQLHRRTVALAAELHSRHRFDQHSRLGIMCRNHRGFAEAMFAGAALGADLVFLNTEFSAPQLAAVLERERVDVVVHDQEFDAVVSEARFRGPRVLSWYEGEPAYDTVDELADAGASTLPRTRRASRIVVLTSGTTGTPKGAPRHASPLAVALPITSLLSKMPLRSGTPMLVAPPIFHGFGLAYLSVAVGLGCPLVLTRRFDPEAILALIEQHRVGYVFAVPVMLQRIIQLPAEVRRRHDSSSLRAVGSAASALSGDLACAFMDDFGDVLFNLYGTTETGFSTIATPRDLRQAPGTIGRVIRGVQLVILGPDDREQPTGEVGRVFVGSRMTFEGYSGGGNKKTVRGLMSTGDLGHVAPGGLVFIDGRDDDMIVSGGENVFPQEVEELLARHDAVADVAVVGVPDEDFGQRLAAFVVTAPGAGVTADDLRAYVRANLARFKVPRDVEFVTELPRTATGKVVRRQLAPPRDHASSMRSVSE
jgi:acyl-CoA synthetase (AMP-forming)/AMP-acid ligase II